MKAWKLPINADVIDPRDFHVTGVDLFFYEVFLRIVNQRKSDAMSLAFFNVSSQKRENLCVISGYL